MRTRAFRIYQENPKRKRRGLIGRIMVGMQHNYLDVEKFGIEYGKYNKCFTRKQECGIKRWSKVSKQKCLERYAREEDWYAL